MADSTLEHYSELVGLVIQGKFPIMPKPEWGQDVAFLGWFIDELWKKHLPHRHCKVGSSDEAHL